MRIRKKALILLAMISLLNCLVLIQDTYSKYKSEASGSANISIARWNILVNEADIKNNRDFSQMITPVFEETEDIAGGVIAPTSEGYFDLVINYEGVDVSFDYSLNVQVSGSSGVTDLKIIGYRIDEEDVVSLNSSSYAVTQKVKREEAKKTVSYRFFVTWDDSSEATMNNVADTEATTVGKKAVFDVSASFIQSTT